MGRVVELRSMCLAAPLRSDCRSTSDELGARTHTGTRAGDAVAVADQQERDQRELGARPFEDRSRRGAGAEQQDDEEPRESGGCKPRSIGSGLLYFGATPPIFDGLPCGDFTATCGIILTHSLRSW